MIETSAPGYNMQINVSQDVKKRRRSTFLLFAGCGELGVESGEWSSGGGEPGEECLRSFTEWMSVTFDVAFLAC